MAKAKAGQALIEFCIGLIAFLAVVGGMFQLGRLGLARLDTRVRATRLATERSMRSEAETGVYVPSYLSRVDDGEDGYSYSQDDVSYGGDADAAYARIVERMRPGDVRGRDPRSPVGGMDDAYEMRAAMGFVQGIASDFNIPILPVVRRLFFNQSSVDIQTEVWMTRTGDIY
jgi:hypothetical protein